MSKYVTFSFSVLLAKGPSNIRVVYCRNDLYASGKFVELHDSGGGANPDVAISVASCGSFGSGMSDTMISLKWLTIGRFCKPNPVRFSETSSSGF